MAAGMAAGGIIGGAFSLGGAALTAAKNMDLAKAQMKFQERMSNTAYQRSMKDMRKAGLNPILAAKIGGATTPPGAYHPIESGIADRAIESAKSGAKAATEIQLLAKQKDQVEANTALANAQRSKVETDAVGVTLDNTKKANELPASEVKAWPWRMLNSAKQIYQDQSKSTVRKEVETGWEKAPAKKPGETRQRPHVPWGGMPESRNPYK